MKNFFYKNNDIIVVLLILIVAAFLIYDRVGVIMAYPEKAAAQSQAQTVQDDAGSSETTEQELK